MITALAPMWEVTDVVFREIITKTAKPNYLYTEFVNVDGLQSKSNKAKGIFLQKLKFTKDQKPIIAQIWGLQPKNFEQTASMLKDMGFDGIDLNMGCPDKNVLKVGACSALINDRLLADKIIKATIKGSNGLPVSVKTRLGIKKYQTEEWISFLLQYNLHNITIHGRTVSQMSKDFANWQQINKAVEIRNKLNSNTLIIGNGDIKDYSQAVAYKDKYKVDGVMIGRGIFNNLWAFEKSLIPHTHLELLSLLKLHINLYFEEYGENCNLNTLKRYFKIYVRNHPNAKELRTKLMLGMTKDQLLSIINNNAHF